MANAKRVRKENKWGQSSRFYDVNGKKMPSVTTILSCIGKPALVNWAAKVEREMVMEVAGNLYHEIAETPRMSKLGFLTTMADRLGKTKASQKELAKAGEIGTQAHAWIEWTIKAQLMHVNIGPCPVISAPATLAVSAWERWKNSVEFKPLRCEQAVWSHTHQYAGTMDLLAEINGRLTLLDWKSGKKIYPEASLQNIAYRYALEEMGLISSVNDCDGMVVRLPKVETDPEPEVGKVEGYPGDLMQVFLHVKALWEWTQKDEVLTETPPVDDSQAIQYEAQLAEQTGERVF